MTRAADTLTSERTGSSTTSATITSASSSKSDGFLFAGDDYYNCYCWDVLSATGTHIYQLVAHENRVSCLGVNPAGQALVTGNWDALLKRVFGQ
ncbi:hypothetical protein V7S43_010360 [Phytophthora oleae]|uniref:Uncharacterized protein n=1 Tax=Phytophthora oleae TaxID=2107226 RepID=A0ABD3FDX4_9STRA